MELDHIFSWGNATTKSPLQKMEDYYEERKKNGETTRIPDLYGKIIKDPEEAIYLPVSTYFVLSLEDYYLGGRVRVSDDDMCSCASVKQILSLPGREFSLSNIKILKCKDDQIVDGRSLILRLQELNPKIMASRSREMIRIKAELDTYGLLYRRPGARRRTNGRTAA